MLMFDTKLNGTKHFHDYAFACWLLARLCLAGPRLPPCCPPPPCTHKGGGQRWPRPASLQLFACTHVVKCRHEFLHPVLAPLQVEIVKAYLRDEVLRHPPTRPVYLLGESFGGVLAVAVAAECPHLVDRVVLVNPATSYPRSVWPLIGPLLPQVRRGGSAPAAG